MSRIIPFIGLALFILAVWILSRELASYHLAGILAGIRQIPMGQVAAALLLTMLNYLNMTAYDTAGVRYVNHPLRLVGAIGIGIIIADIVFNRIGKTSFKIGDWDFSRPTVNLQGMLLGIAILDWALAGSILYVLLPDTAPVSWTGFLGLFLLAQIAGIASQIPGGVGVFETAMLLLMSPFIPSTEMIGVLLAYRGSYYLIPLLAATLLLGLRELVHSKDSIGKLASGIGLWMSISLFWVPITNHSWQTQ